VNGQHLLKDGEDVRIRRVRRTWGRAIAAQRKAIGMTQRQLADTVGVSPQAVGTWERGETAPRPHLQPEIARALGVAWSVLFQPEAA
jgi:transcriptional regulator with XRE-family HTH domain